MVVVGTIELKELLECEAENIRKALKSMELWGHPVDMGNPDHVLVGAYYMGRIDMERLRNWGRVLPRAKPDAPSP